MKKNKQFESVIFSTVGILVVLVIFIAVNIIVGMFPARVDLTEDKLFTLSKGTRNILGKLESKVKIRFYVTQGENEMPVMLKNYAQQVEDLLAEFRQASKGKIEIQKLNPTPDSDAEDSAELDGVEGQMLRSGSRIYMGLSISALDEKAVIPFLSPERDRLLEYDITREIARVANPTKPVIGIMTALPIWGQPANPMMRMQGMQGQEPWIFLSELKRDFDVKQIEVTADSIPDDVKVLLVIHPKNITEAGQWAIDQFVLKGGKLIAMVDPQSVTDQQNPMGMNRGPSGGSNLEKLFAAWGIQYEPSKVIADPTYATRIRGRNGQPEENATFLSFDQKAIDKNNIITSQIDSLLMAWVGSFSGTPVEGLKQTPLLKTSGQSQQVEAFLASMGQQAIARDMKPGGKELTIALRLTGKFKTAFPNGKPAAPPEPEEDEEGKKKEPKQPEPPVEGLKEGKAENSVILIADSDFLFDQFSVQKQEFLGQVLIQPFNGNLTLTQNMVEQFAGDENLIEMRSRATISRPFTVVRDMQAKAQAKYQDRLKELETKSQEAQQKINELQRAKDKSQRFILSKEQETEVAKYKEERSKAERDLKDLRKELRSQVDWLQTKIKLANIAGVPAFVCLVGLGLALYKRKLTAAK